MKRTEGISAKVCVLGRIVGNSSFLPLTAGAEGQSAPKTGWAHRDGFGWQRQDEDALDRDGRLAQPSTRTATAAVSNSNKTASAAEGIPPKQFLFGHVEGKEAEEEENLGATRLLEADDAGKDGGQQHSSRCVIGPISKNLIAPGATKWGGLKNTRGKDKEGAMRDEGEEDGQKTAQGEELFTSCPIEGIAAAKATSKSSLSSLLYSPNSSSSNHQKPLQTVTTPSLNNSQSKEAARGGGKSSTSPSCALKGLPATDCQQQQPKGTSATITTGTSKNIYYAEMDKRINKRFRTQLFLQYRDF